MNPASDGAAWPTGGPCALPPATCPRTASRRRKSGFLPHEADSSAPRCACRSIPFAWPRSAPPEAVSGIGIDLAAPVAHEFPAARSCRQIDRRLGRRRAAVALCDRHSHLVANGRKMACCRNVLAQGAGLVVAPATARRRWRLGGRHPAQHQRHRRCARISADRARRARSRRRSPAARRSPRSWPSSHAPPQRCPGLGLCARRPACRCA